MRTGTTATVAVLSKTHITVGQVGDSRALLVCPCNNTALYDTSMQVTRAGPVVLSDEHRATNDAERARVVKAGACVPGGGVSEDAVIQEVESRGVARRGWAACR